jgi:hypothetical protein
LKFSSFHLNSRKACLLALIFSAGFGFAASELRAQASSLLIADASQPDSAATDASSANSAQPEAISGQAPAAAQSSTTLSNTSVQARIKARREARRAAAIHDVYTHLYEVYVGGGYLRFTPGDSLQRLNEYNWNVGVTRYFNQRLGVTVDGRGNYGSAYLDVNQAQGTGVYKPAISQYSAMIGPTYRFYMQPKYSISGRVMGGVGYGNFTGDLGPFTPEQFGLYSNGVSAVVSASVPFEYNVSPRVGLRVAPEYVLTTYGSTIQNNLGFTAGLVVRWGRQ